jgi:hypothetical protein
LVRWLHNWKSINNLILKKRMIKSMRMIQPIFLLITVRILKEIKWLKKYLSKKSMSNKMFNWTLILIILSKINIYYLLNLRKNKRKVFIIKRNSKNNNSFNKEMKLMFLNKSLYKICQYKTIKCLIKINKTWWWCWIIKKSNLKWLKLPMIHSSWFKEITI